MSLQIRELRVLDEVTRSSRAAKRPPDFFAVREKRPLCGVDYDLRLHKPNHCRIVSGPPLNGTTSQAFPLVLILSTDLVREMEVDLPGTIELVTELSGMF